jgi:hypothetical protein
VPVAGKKTADDVKMVEEESESEKEDEDDLKKTT